ncbi:hypothetical protein AY601_1764 [Pedobacter cryoconitis]|uniref:Uncharacterized protein n=1 Tax=Pedobacter cryoconitis TaxID=188932 RepID=A0A127VBS2_9SPHI|nr:UPF0489 family protein [Pedobacter cryoconitis]AMP98677.1 hypothetical protein AY601_1764 [Pedobacter cryoconitis]
MSINEENPNQTWIRKPDLNKVVDGIWELGFIYQSGKVYIMDNHSGAGWCWLHHLDSQQKYGFFHIDTHDDLVSNEAPAYMRSLLLNKEMTIDEYCSIPTDMKGSADVKPLFRFDNFIANLNHVFPAFFNTNIFSINEPRQKVPPGFKVNRFIEPEVLLDLFPAILKSEAQWIIDLDIDYFFQEKENNDYVQFLDNDYIDELCEKICMAKDSIAVITIAMSQYFCGGWKNSKRVTERVAKNLDISIDLPEDYDE